jgi:hypothetical protein
MVSRGSGIDRIELSRGRCQFAVQPRGVAVQLGGVCGLLLNIVPLYPRTLVRHLVHVLPTLIFRY